jgi:hypothetical protein
MCRSRVGRCHLSDDFDKDGRRDQRIVVLFRGLLEKDVSAGINKKTNFRGIGNCRARRMR